MGKQDRIYKNMNAAKEVVAAVEEVRKEEQKIEDEKASLNVPIEKTVSVTTDERVGSSLSRALNESRALSEGGVANRLTSATPFVKSLMAQLDSYISKASPNRIQSDEEFLRVQNSWINFVQNVVTLEETTDFIQCMTYLLDRINENRTGVFSDELIYRNWRSLKLSDKRILEYADFTHMVLSFANPANRRNIVERYPIEENSRVAGQYKDRLAQYISRIAGQ